MTEEALQVFIEGVLNYFRHTADKGVKVGSPYLAEDIEPIMHDFTGIIGVSGPYRGSVYFSAPKLLLTHLLLALGEVDTSAENILDLVGEVANTISGNARKSFGREFLISVPVMIEGVIDKLYTPKHTRCFVIPVYWKSYAATVVVCLEH
ncbi:MAG TPA: chemotaxis protein CheX [Cellvibrionaceae bacterium]